MDYSNEELREAYQQLEAWKGMLEIFAGSYGRGDTDEEIIAERERMRKEIKAYKVACECIKQAETNGK